MTQQMQRRRAPSWRRALSRLTSTQGELEAEELQDQVREAGSRPIGDCGDRERVTLRGTLRAVTLRPVGGVPALEADLYDGSGSVTVIWLGQRRIAGIEAGRDVVVSGRVAVHDGERILYNPRYELLPRSG